jgi:TfoX/Sxy family transcriptional regulator of competence genes
MATRPETIEEILARTGDTVELRPRKMFGEYGFYLGDRMVALVCDDTLFVKDLPQCRELVGNLPLQPPYPGAKPHLVLAPEVQEREGLLADLFRTLARILPAPRPRTTKAKVRKEG